MPNHLRARKSHSYTALSATTRSIAAARAATTAAKVGTVRAVRQGGRTARLIVGVAGGGGRFPVGGEGVNGKTVSEAVGLVGDG